FCGFLTGILSGLFEPPDASAGGLTIDAPVSCDGAFCDGAFCAGAFCADAVPLASAIAPSSAANVTLVGIGFNPFINPPRFHFFITCRLCRPVPMHAACRVGSLVDASMHNGHSFQTCLQSSQEVLA